MKKYSNLSISNIYSLKPKKSSFLSFMFIFTKSSVKNSSNTLWIMFNLYNYCWNRVKRKLQGLYLRIGGRTCIFNLRYSNPRGRRKKSREELKTNLAKSTPALINHARNSMPRL